MAGDGVHTVPGKLYVPYHNWFGALASRFFGELRDQRRLSGTRCVSCQKVYMPPRSICPDCLARLDTWVQLPPTGTLVTYTVVHHTYSSYYQPQEAPYPVGIIKIDGADTGLCHLLSEVNSEEIAVGMRVEAVFRKERRGNILDIAYFKPV